MAIAEIFPNPTVKSVFFELRFPNLFFLESKVGDFQLKVLEHFPESALLYRRQFMFADLAPGASPADIHPPQEDLTARKAWQFKSPLNYSFTLETNLLVISSHFHKTYNLGEGDRFRDIVKYVVDAFLSVVQLPLFQRIGLRYLDECPLPSKDNQTLTTYYNTAFPIGKFSLTDAQEMRFHTVVRQGDSYLRYVEQLIIQADNTYRLLLDFDGFREKVQASEYLTVTDGLHDIISSAYESTIKEPVYEYMRTPKGN